MTIDKLNGILGMGKMAAILERKAKNKIEAKEKVIEKVLSDVSSNGVDVGNIEESEA